MSPAWMRLNLSSSIGGNNTYSLRMKHIAHRVFFLKEMVARNTIVTEFVARDVLDIFTKSMIKEVLDKV